ncbi:Octaprenyl-diphosphate synthase [Bacteroidales bacterium Barb6XT]|nr:Octaprenyl-diphosphate synthase [Bacteroidales bacterium Barb6XT]
MEDLSSIQAPVANELIHFREDFAASMKSSTRRLQTSIDFLLATSGKQIRPLLTLLAAKACGTVTKDTVNAAVLLELLHTATLIHDDVVDETKLRRGNPSLNAVFDNRIAVLTGDYVLSTALARAIQTGNLHILRIVSNLGRELSEGEIAELEAVEESLLDEARYMHIIHKKTASLLSACAEIGALSACAGDEAVAVCREFGKHLGYCFQIKDDIFDYYKDTDIGKPTGNDIREGKVTLPLLYALREGEKEAAASALHIIRSQSFTEENIDTLLSFAKQSGGIEYAEGKMKEHFAEAVKLLDKLPASTARTSLAALANYIVIRKK